MPVIQSVFIRDWARPNVYIYIYIYIAPVHLVAFGRPRKAGSSRRDRDPSLPGERYLVLQVLAALSSQLSFFLSPLCARGDNTLASRLHVVVAAFARWFFHHEQKSVLRIFGLVIKVHNPINRGSVLVQNGAVYIWLSIWRVNILLLANFCLHHRDSAVLSMAEVTLGAAVLSLLTWRVVALWGPI